MATPEQFTRNINRRARQVRNVGPRVLRAAAGAVLVEVVRDTPVDEGETRGGWVVGIGTPRRSETGNRDKSGTATIASGQSVLSGLRRSTTVFVSNSTEAIIPLDREGRSPQARAGFVRAGIERVARGLFARFKVFED